MNENSPQPLRVQNKPLSLETIRLLEKSGSYETARIARELLRPRRRWYRLWRLTPEQRELVSYLDERPES